MKAKHIMSQTRLIIVAENASMKMGGESARPLQHLLHLSGRGAAANVIVRGDPRPGGVWEALDSKPSKGKRIVDRFARNDDTVRGRWR